MEKGRKQRLMGGRMEQSRKRIQQTYLLPQSILEVTFCLSSLNSSLGSVPDRSWERHSINSHISLWTCLTRTVLLAQTGRSMTTDSDTRTNTHSHTFHKDFLFYHKELLPYASPFPQCGGHLLHQGHLCRRHYLLISVATFTITQRNQKAQLLEKNDVYTLTPALSRRPP